MFSLIVATASIFTASPADVFVHTLDGNKISGALRAISGETVEVLAGEGVQIFDSRNVVSVEPAEPFTRPQGRSELRVELVDGSLLNCRSFEINDRTAIIELIGGHGITMESRGIAAAQLRDFNDQPELQQQWSTIYESDRAGDKLVVLKKSTVDEEASPRVVLALDSVEGVLRNITPTLVHFEFADREIPVDRNKVAGVIYYQPAGRQLPEPVCRIVDLNGSQWFTRSVTLQDEHVRIVSPAGAELDLPLSQVARFDFSAVNTDFLHELTPITDSWRLKLAFGRKLAELKSSYQQFSNAHYGGNLKLYSESGFGHGAPGERVFDHGIAMHSQSERQYLLSRKYKQFSAVVGIDARYRQFGNVHLTVTGDRRVLFEGTISGADPEPIDLDLDVSGVRRLSLVVDHGQGGGIGDRLNFCNARLSK